MTAARQVSCELDFEVADPATVILRVAPASVDGVRPDEDLQVTVDGDDVAVEVLPGDHGAVVHVVRSPLGSLRVVYRATVAGAEEVDGPGSSGLDEEQLAYLRQSRYCPSDVLSGLAAYELGHLAPGPELLTATGTWVASRLTYELGASGPLDTAVDSLLAGRGVCRDFAHLAISMLRALEVPARLVGVYAPGLSPMDFHAVVEAHVEGRWRLLDPTRLAPRSSLVRVATGRDAADTAFITVLGGEAELTRSEISAITDGDLPDDDHLRLISLA